MAGGVAAGTDRVTGESVPPRLPPALVLHQQVAGATVAVWVESGPGPVKGYLWEFGDGVVSREGPRVAHTYRDPGRYRVFVAVQGEDDRWRVATADEVVVVP